MYSNDFLISYNDFLSYYRIYYWNISRQIKYDNSNKFINIITGMQTASCKVYIVFKTFSTDNLKFNKNDGLVVYKSQ